MSLLKVTAHMSSPIAGDAPRLDALVEYQMSLHHHPGAEGYKLDRLAPAPPVGSIPIPIERRRLGPWLVAHCSNPIYSEATDRVEYFTKRIESDHAGKLAESSRRIMATGNSWTKSYRLPLRLRAVDRVVWFASAFRRPLLKCLRKIRSIGKKRSIGYGAVYEWDIEETDDDLAWFARCEQGTLLMATLPLGDWLPQDLVGFRRGYEGVCPPYWHPDRLGEVVVPC